MNFKLEFYYQQLSKYGCLVFFKNETEKDERWNVDVISKIYHDQPLKFEELIIENCLINLDINKEFTDELELKNWLINNNYSRMGCKNQEYECWERKLDTLKHYTERNIVSLYAIWRKE